MGWLIPNKDALYLSSGMTMIFSSSLDGTRGWGIDQLIVYIRYGSLFYKFSTGGYFAREVNEWLKVTKEFWWSWECCITPLECSILSPLFTCNPMERGGCLSLAGSFGCECVDKSVLVLSFGKTGNFVPSHWRSWSTVVYGSRHSGVWPRTWLFPCTRASGRRNIILLQEMTDLGYKQKERIISREAINFYHGPNW